MNRHTVVVSCPIDCYSGYSARSRDIVRALIALDKYNVKILSQRWGNTRFGFLKDHKDVELSSRIIPRLTSQPDIWIQITVPNEFQPVGKYNIGITAGIETTLAHASWIEGCNKMNLVLTSSNHSKTVFESSKFKAVDQRTNQELREIKLNTPVEVLFEGVDTGKYFEEKGNKFDLSYIQESFCYLFIGHWLPGDLGHDRKNVGYLVKSFLETFKNKRNPPALILKTQIKGASIMDKNAVLKQLESIKKTVRGSHPNIYLIHGDLSDKQINSLYNNNKVKAMITLTKGEGFCRPLLEFSMSNKPIISSGWSGPLDFLGTDSSLLIGGTLEKVHGSAVVKDMIMPEADWFKPNDEEVYKAYRDVVKNYKKHLVRAKKQSYRVKTEFSLEKMTEKLDEILDKYTVDLPIKLDLKLPNLKLPMLEKIDKDEK